MARKCMFLDWHQIFWIRIRNIGSISRLNVWSLIKTPINICVRATWLVTFIAMLLRTMLRRGRKCEYVSLCISIISRVLGLSVACAMRRHGRALHYCYSRTACRSMLFLRKQSHCTLHIDQDR